MIMITGSHLDHQEDPQLWSRPGRKRPRPKEVGKEMSLQALRDLKFAALTDEEAAAASGEGKPSRARCEWIFAQIGNPMSCSHGDYYGLWKSLGCDKL